MVRKPDILSNFINCSLLISEMLSPFNLHDLKWQIVWSSPEINEMIDLWMFSSKYLSKIPPIIEEKYLSITSIGWGISYNNKLNISMFKSFFDFKNSTEFINFFDICMFAYSIYFNILDGIEHIFKILKPKQKVFFEFSNILKNIKKNGNNYEITDDICIIPNVIVTELNKNKNITTRIIDLRIKINSCGKVPQKFIGSFNKIKDFVLSNSNNDLFALDFIIQRLINKQKELVYDCVYVCIK